MDGGGETMVELSDWANLADIPPEPLLNIDLFQYDLCESLEDYDLQLDSPLPPAQIWALPQMPCFDQTVADWGQGDTEGSALHLNDIKSYMFEQIFFGSRHPATTHCMAPYPTTPSSSELDDDVSRCNVEPFDLNLSGEFPGTEEEQLPWGRLHPYCQPKRLFALGEIDFSTKAANISNANIAASGRQQLRTTKKAKVTGKARRDSQGSSWTGAEQQEGCSSGSDDDPPESEAIGAIHNILERKRRDDLRASFDGLRVMVPSLLADSKTPKVSILQGACHHIKNLQITQLEIKQQKQEQLERQASMKAHLLKLQAMCECAVP